MTLFGWSLGVLEAFRSSLPCLLPLASGIYCKYKYCTVSNLRQGLRVGPLFFSTRARHLAKIPCSHDLAFTVQVAGAGNREAPEREREKKKNQAGRFNNNQRQPSSEGNELKKCRAQVPVASLEYMKKLRFI